MYLRKIIIVCIFFLAVLNEADAQPIKVQQGLLFKRGTNIRLGSVQVLNKRSLVKINSSVIGVFNIPATVGDTLTFTSENFQSTDFVVSDFADKVIYLEPVIQLDEVTVKEYSLQSGIKETQRGYRKKSVFYTGTPHYYYLFLKPMTFIYENFKSEVKDARRFNKYAGKELAAYKISEHFNDNTIKKNVPIKDTELEDFKSAYTPTLSQINDWSDYDLINYIKRSYTDFEKNGVNGMK